MRTCPPRTKQTAPERQRLYKISALCYLSLISLVVSARAHAYMDPGTGSMLLQIILGGLAGLAVAGKLFWHRILTALGLRKTEPASDPEPAPRPEPEDH